MRKLQNFEELRIFLVPSPRKWLQFPELEEEREKTAMRERERERNRTTKKYIKINGGFV